VGHKFSLVLSREITDDESAILRESCSGTTFTTDTLPTNADVTVTRVDVDDAASPSLAEAIEAGLEAVKKVPDLSVPGLTVPAQPVERAASEPAAAAADASANGSQDTAAKKPAAKRTATRSAAKKPAAKKPAAKKTAAKKASATDDAQELVEAAARS
jgi:hypothetical protein